MTNLTNRIQTVNVIEYVNDQICCIKSYSENESGNIEAETLFETLLKEYDKELTKEEIEICIEDGFYEQGNYQVFLVHSF